MSESAAQVLIMVWAAYAVIGVIFGVWFVLRAIDRVDPAAQQSSRGFRFIVLPGVAALWPFLALRLARGSGHPPEEKNAHRQNVHPRASRGRA